MPETYGRKSLTRAAWTTFIPAECVTTYTMAGMGIGRRRNKNSVSSWDGGRRGERGKREKGGDRSAEPELSSYRHKYCKKGNLL